MTARPAPRGGPLDRFLRLFSDVRSGEGGTALLLALNVFILLTAYSTLKVLREPLILAVPGGAELKSYSSAGQAIVLVFLVPLYGLVARRVPRRLLINVVTAFFMACLAKHPADRPATAQQLAERLAAVPLEQPWTAERARRWWDDHLPQPQECGDCDQGTLVPEMSAP